MARSSDRGKKVCCPKCNTQYYDLGRKSASCPTCRKNLLIPAGTVARVRLSIRPGGYNDDDQGWTDGYATRSKAGAVYLNCHLAVIEGTFTERNLTSLIGLYTPKGLWWGNKGRKTLRSILNSAHGLLDDDYSPEALRLRQVKSFEAFDGIEFVAEIDCRKGTDGIDRNELKAVVSPGDRRFEKFSGDDASSTPDQAGNEVNNIAPINSPSDKSGYTPIWLQKV